MFSVTKAKARLHQHNKFDSRNRSCRHTGDHSEAVVQSSYKCYRTFVCVHVTPGTIHGDTVVKAVQDDAVDVILACHSSFKWPSLGFRFVASLRFLLAAKTGAENDNLLKEDIGIPVTQHLCDDERIPIEMIAPLVGSNHPGDSLFGRATPYRYRNQRELRIILISPY
jgi:hypothetical protein